MSELTFRVTPADNDRLANLCGQFDEHLKQIEQRLGVEISNRGDQFQVVGDDLIAANTKKLIAHLYAATATEKLAPERVHLYLQDAGIEHMQENPKPATSGEIIKLGERLFNAEA